MATREKMQKRYRNLSEMGIRRAAESLQRRAGNEPLTEDEIADQRERVRRRTGQKGKYAMQKLADSMKNSIVRESAARQDTNDLKAKVKLKNDLAKAMKKR